MINCQIELDLTWSKNYVFSEILKTPEVGGGDVTETTGTISQIINAKLYVQVVALSINDNVRFLENIKQGFKRSVS